MDTFLMRATTLTALLTAGCAVSLAQSGQLKRQVDFIPGGSIRAASAPSGAHLTYYGGPIVQHPKYYDVLWGSGVDAYHTSVDLFLTQAASSLDFNSVLNQYTGAGGTTIGLGSFIGGSQITPANTGKSLTDAEIQVELQAQITAGNLPANDPDTLYIIMFPPGISITSGGGGSCVSGGFCAYHGTINGTNGKTILYTVLPDQGPTSGCSSGCGGNALLVNNVTSVISHEVAETITDANVGLATFVGFPIAWYDSTNGENGDICNAQQSVIVGWTIQQTFSNLDNDCVASRADFLVAGTGLIMPTTGAGASTITSQAVLSKAALTVALSTSGLPAGVSASFSSSSITAGTGTTLNLTSTGAAPGPYNFTLTGTGRGLVRSVQVALTITAIVAQPQTITFAPLADRQLSASPFTVSATATSGLPVSFSSLTAATCSVSGTSVTLLAAGSCTIRAGQAGNGSFLPAPAVDRSFNITKSDQTINFGSLADVPLSTGSITVGATATSGLTVSFASLTSGTCTVLGTTVTLVAAGGCTIRASQAGNAQYNAAPNVDQSFTINKSPQTITFAPLADRQLTASPFTVSATATSGLPVSFSSLTAATCSVSGTSVTLLAAGSCTIQAGQAGNSSFLPALPVTNNFNITKGDQTIHFGSLADVPLSTGSITVGATATSGLTVSFGSLTSGTCTVSGTTVTLVAAGGCTIRASQAGNAQYNAAPNADQSFTINKSPQTITFAPLADRQLTATPFTVSATATSGLPVSFSSLTAATCSVSGTSVTLLAAGSCTIQAGQAGNSSFLPALPVTNNFNITKGDQTIHFGSLADVPLSTGSITVSATATSGLTVSFASLTSGTCTVSGTTVTLVAAGGCTIRASQTGNAQYNAAPNVDQSFTINKSPQTITFPAIPNKSLFTTGPFTIIASSSSGLPVSFRTLTPGVCLVTGKTAYVISFGTCSIEASQPGNASYLPATPVVRSFQVLFYFF